jgi:hypothetical protein
VEATDLPSSEFGPVVGKFHRGGTSCDFDEAMTNHDSSTSPADW